MMLRHFFVLAPIVAAFIAGCAQVTDLVGVHDPLYRSDKAIRCEADGKVRCDVSSSPGIKYSTVALRTPAGEETFRETHDCASDITLKWDPIVPYASVALETCDSAQFDLAVALHEEDERTWVLIGRTQTTLDLAVPGGADQRTHWNCGPLSSTPFLPCETLERFCLVLGGTYEPIEPPVEPLGPEEPSAVCEPPEWPPVHEPSG